MSQIMLISAIAGGSLILLLSIWAFISKNYIRIAPNTAAIIFGRKNKSSQKDANGNAISKGYRTITGGGFFKIPFFEEVQFMNLSNRMLSIKVENAPNKDGVMTSIEGNANVKFASENELLDMAVERFLGKTDQEINVNIHENLAGHLRAVVGKMSIEQLINDKTSLNAAILDEANEDFMKMGIKIDFINIQDISDNDNYIKNLGRKRIAEIKRDAEIGTAEAERDAVKSTTEAQRIGVEMANANQVKIYESNKERDIKLANMKALVDKQNEIAIQAGPLSNAEALQAVVEAQATTAAAKEQANVKVEKAKAEKEVQRFNAEKLVPAEAIKQAMVIEAEGKRQAAIIQAEGERDAIAIIAKGNADAVLLTKKAEAEGQAAIVREQGLAEASAIEAKLLAEAKGTLEKAKAYEKLDKTGRLLEILSAAQTLGPNLVKEFAGVMSATTAHLANVNDVKIIDFGGNGGNGSGSVAKFGQAPVEILNKFVAGMGATGFDVSKLTNFLGINEEVKDVKELPNNDNAKANTKVEPKK